MLADFSTPVEDFASSQKALTFEYKATGDAPTGVVQFTLWGGAGGTWSPRLTDLATLDVLTNSLSGVTGSVRGIGNGWYRVTINLSDFAITNGQDGTETVRKLYFNTVSHAFLLDGVGFTDAE